MTYISNTDRERKEMLSELGLNSIDELFDIIPKDLQSASFNLPEAKSEFEVRGHLQLLAKKNATNLISFLGGGFYEHYIPAAVDSVISRSEFYTAYTPYQPEISQGVLQAIYEYQSAICRLTDMEVSNASLYDGGTALYEAAMMSVRITQRRKIIVDEGVNPIYRKMLHCYTSNLSLEFVEIPIHNGIVDRGLVKKGLDNNTSAIILQNPNFFGCIDDFTDIVEKAHSVGALAISSVYPISLGILKTPGDMGIDITTGEGQSLGLPLLFGGPYLGFMAALKKYVRKMPGRIVGRAHDNKGRNGFVLTLQTREQHIRREKATSNICTNETLCALQALAYLSLLGRKGLKEVAQLCADKAAYTSKRLTEISGVKKKFSQPFFNEFTLELTRDAGEVIGRLIEKGFAAGLPLGRYYKDMEQCMLVAVTEKRTKDEIGHLREALENVL